MPSNDVTLHDLLRLVERAMTSDRQKTAQSQRQSDVVREFIETHLNQVYRFALHLLRDHHAAQDVAQEAILRAWKNRHTLQQQESARSWILKITGNLCRDAQRRAGHAVSVAKPYSDDETTNSVLGPLDRVLYDEQQQIIHRLIAELPDRERTILFLSAVEQLSNSEIAQVLGIKAGAVKVALFRARKSVRQKLIELEDEPETKSHKRMRQS